MTALAGTGVPVPARRPSRNLDVNDRVYVMEKVDGRHLRDGGTEQARSRAGTPFRGARGRDGPASIRGLRGGRLGEFGNPEGYLERQIGVGAAGERSRTRELPGVDELARRLAGPRSESGPPTIVHGDYRLDNTMMARRTRTIVAGPDWEIVDARRPARDLGLSSLLGERGAPDHLRLLGDRRARGVLTSDEVVSDTRGSAVAGSTRSTGIVGVRVLQARDHRGSIHARYRWQDLGEGFDAWRDRGRLIDSALHQANRSSIPELRADVAVGLAVAARALRGSGRRVHRLERCR